ncbi:bifunctional tRNA (5-methylaminomethyl-2-thiouridine)(34)-methyltransferase MnmD/FAD-dependent 5-carboxymethylaminomethyl-2-thiouridine(34) oxidoreductase MnmC, partial [Ralstonia solanacearum]
AGRARLAHHLIDEHEAPAGGTSAHRAAAMHPHVSIDDSVLSRLSRAATCWRVAIGRRSTAPALPPVSSPTAVLQLAEHADDAAEQQRIVQVHGFPADFIAWLDAARAADRVGAGVPQGGWWFAQAGWVAPPDICRAALAAAGEAVELRWRTRIESLLRHDAGWQACDAQGNVIARAPVVVLANSLDAVRLAPLASAALKPVRGQLTDVPVAALEDGVPWPRAVVCGDGYLLPRERGAPTVRVGSSFQPGEADPDARTADHAANLRRLAGLQPRMPPPWPAWTRRGSMATVGVRSVSVNRLPLIGAVADEAVIMAPGFRLRGPHAALPRVPGLYAALAYGSRGLTWSVLGAELLAAQIDGGPLPLESELAAALDPGRFLMRALRHGKHAA